jgi:threonine/homoserine/homoserine lactone efflux protein
VEARLLAFLGVAIIVTVTPGPDFALVTRMAFAKGRTAAWRTSLGVVTGHLLWGMACGIGVTAVLDASATLYTILRLAGAVYLVWLGLHALSSRAPATDKTTEPDRPSHAGAYRQGLVNDLLNPKIGVFYTTLLPQFIAPGQPFLPTSLSLAAIMACIVATWLGLYVALLDRASIVLHRPRVRRIMEGITGVVLIALGLRVAIEH